MTVSLRVDKLLAKQLEAAAKKAGVSKSELVRRLLRQYFDEPNHRPNAWDLGKDLFGRAGSGRADLSRDRKKIVREKMRAKANHG